MKFDFYKYFCDKFVKEGLDVAAKEGERKKKRWVGRREGRKGRITFVGELW